jgi:hypothetical protein
MDVNNQVRANWKENRRRHPRGLRGWRSRNIGLCKRLIVAALFGLHAEPLGITPLLFFHDNKKSSYQAILPLTAQSILKHALSMLSTTRMYCTKVRPCA